MRSNYKPIGDFIELVDKRNKKLEVDLLLGLSISKEFIPSVANTIGANMANYKIIRKGQFACSIMQVRRDKKMPVALLKDFEEAIISQAYPVFQIKDEKQLLPEYLMMWFSRSEFDRHACFLAVGGVRGSLEWEDFLEMELPIPSIEKQRAIVAEYNTVVNRIKLNEQLNQKLEETAQTLYKHWFVDFEFPISAEQAASMGQPNLEGKPYKSSGGKMIYNAELDKEIPEGWEVDSLFNNTILIKRGISPKYAEDGILVINQRCIRNNSINLSLARFHNQILRKVQDEKIVQSLDVLVNSTGTGTLGRVGIVKSVRFPLTVDSHVTIVRARDGLSKYFLGSYLSNNEQTIIELGEGSTGQTELSRHSLGQMRIIIPSWKTQELFESYSKKIFTQIQSLESFIDPFKNLKELILTKMTQVEEEELIQSQT